MGKTTIKKICWLLCLVLVLSMVPAVFAAEADTELFDLKGSSMTLGNTLEINFAIDTTKLTGTDNYIVISKEYADDRGTVTKTVQQSDWAQLSETTSYVSYSVTAKEMNDKLTVVAYNAAGEQLTNVYEDSVAAYCLRTLAKEEAKENAEAKKLALFVDMVNYGAAAQEEWDYNTDSLANAGLTETQKGYATQVGEKKNILEEGEGYYGTSLSLKENILMNIAYKANEISDAAYAVVSFVDHYGNDESVKVQAEEFVAQGSNIKYISIAVMAVADYSQAVTVTLYDAEGNAISTTVDSVESYLSRKSGALYDAIAAFGVGAYNYFHTAQDSDPETGDNTTVLSGKVSVENGQVVSDASIGEEGVNAQIPAGVQVESSTLTLTIAEKSAADSGIAAGEGEELLPLDIHIDGVSAENTTPIQVYLGQILPGGLNVGNITLYHKENGVNVPMTQAMTLSELDAHNEFYYDPVTGDVTVAMASFSVVSALYEEAAWKGNADHKWYDANATELIIANADQLWSLSQIVGGMAKDAEGNTIARDSFKGKTIKLIGDINIGDTTDEDGRALVFYPIGYYNDEGTYEKNQDKAISSGFYTFEGTFDGNGHTIANFYQNTWEMKGDDNYYAATAQHYRDGMGLFGKVYGGTVKNLTVENFQSDGEYTTTGVIAAYADCGATFENIAIFNCNPRVYNIGNGGIVGCVGWYAKEATDKPVTFKNITVDNSNKITALWGSWDVACGGLVGQYYPTSGQTSAGSPKNGGIHMENCHVAAQIDVYNDVCANYQYYAYRYAGMLIGSVNKNLPADENGYVYPDMTGITASGCTVHFGDWNDYYYCELVANSLASYTHDHQMSRLEQVADVNTQTKQYLPLGAYEWKDIPNGRQNYVVVNAKDANGAWIHGDGHDFAKCYHFVDGAQHFHDVTDSDNPNPTETVDGVEGVLKEDKQLIYREFNQLITGDGWGVTSRGLTNLEGVTNIDVKLGNNDASVEKFASKIEEGTKPEYLNGKKLTLGELFEETAAEVPVLDAKVQVFVSPVDEKNTGVRCIYSPSKTGNWEDGTVTLLGVGDVTITITDYFYCEPTTITVTLTAHDCAVCNANGAIPWTVEAYTGASLSDVNYSRASSVHSGCYYLADDLVLDHVIDLRLSDDDVTICLNGHKLISTEGKTIYSRIFRIDNGAKVTVDDGTGNGTLVPRGKGITMGSAAYIAHSGSSLTISNCTIDGSQAYTNNQESGIRGGAIRMDANNNNAYLTLTNVDMVNCDTATYTINEGTDKEETYYAWGGALSVTSGIVKLTNCNITDCDSVGSANAIYLSGGTMDLYNTKISNCNSIPTQTYIPKGLEDSELTYYVGSGAVYVTAEGVLNIYEGTQITGNTGSQEGAGILIEGGTAQVNMYGGSVHGNRSTNTNASCGGVKVNGVFNMYGGEVYNNESGTTQSAHEILVYERGKATFKGGTVTDRNDKPGTVVNAYHGSVTIDAGTFNGEVNCSFPYYSVDDPSVLISTPDLTINGGTVTGKIRYSSNETTGEGGYLTITGGIFQSDLIYPKNVIEAHHDRLSIIGGTFHKDISAYVDTGYMWVWDAETSTGTVVICDGHTYENGLCSKCGDEDPVNPPSGGDGGDSNDGEDSGTATPEPEDPTESTESPETTE